MWTTPITDRTAADVAARNAKGFCNYTDLQRLEDNSAHVAALLEVDITTKEWTRADFPSTSELARILQNLDTLRAAYYTKASTPDTPENPVNEWAKWNEVEQILADIYALYNANQEAVSYCGTAYAGEITGR